LAIVAGTAAKVSKNRRHRHIDEDDTARGEKNTTSKLLAYLTFGQPEISAVLSDESVQGMLYEQLRIFSEVEPSGRLNVIVRAAIYPVVLLDYFQPVLQTSPTKFDDNENEDKHNRMPFMTDWVQPYTRRFQATSSVTPNELLGLLFYEQMRLICPQLIQQLCIDFADTSIQLVTEEQESLASRGAQRIGQCPFCSSLSLVVFCYLSPLPPSQIIFPVP
jgi:hypothetical protein